MQSVLPNAELNSQYEVYSFFFFLLIPAKFDIKINVTMNWKICTTDDIFSFFKKSSENGDNVAVRVDSRTFVRVSNVVNTQGTFDGTVDHFY